MKALKANFLDSLDKSVIFKWSVFQEIMMTDPKDRPSGIFGGILNRLSGGSSEPLKEVVPVVSTAPTPAVAVVVASAAPFASPEDLIVMKRITDIVGLTSLDRPVHQEMQAALKAKDAKAFVELAKPWMADDHPTITNVPVKLSTSAALVSMLKDEGFAKELQYYTGERKSPSEKPTLSYAQSAVARLAYAAEMLTQDSNNNWLSATVAKIFDHASKHPKFQEALSEPSSAAQAVRGNVAVLTRTPPAQVEKAPEFSAAVKQGMSWRDGSAPHATVQPPFPRDVGVEAETLYRRFDQQNNKDNGLSGAQRDAAVIKNTLSEFAIATRQSPSSPEFQIRACQMLTDMGIRAPRAAYPEAYVQHIEAATTAAVGPAPANQPAAPVFQRRMAGGMS